MWHFWWKLYLQNYYSYKNMKYLRATNSIGRHLLVVAPIGAMSDFVINYCSIFNAFEVYSYIKFEIRSLHSSRTTF